MNLFVATFIICRRCTVFQVKAIYVEFLENWSIIQSKHTHITKCDHVVYKSRWDFKHTFLNLTYLTLTSDSWNYVEMFYAFSLVFSGSFQIYLYIKSLDSEFLVVFKRALIINFINDEYQKSALNSNISPKSSNLNVYHNYTNLLYFCLDSVSHSVFFRFSTIC